MNFKHTKKLLLKAEELAVLATAFSEIHGHLIRIGAQVLTDKDVSTAIR